MPYTINPLDSFLDTAIKKYSESIDPSGLLTFTYLKNNEEYQDLISLRFRSYIASNTLKINPTLNYFEDIYDKKSIIILANYQGKIIGAERVTFLEEHDESLCYRYIKGNSSYPTLAEMTEASRLCVDPNMQGHSIGYKLETLAILTSYYSKKRYLIGAAAGKLIQFHNNIGFKALGVTFSYPDFINFNHEVLLADSHEIINGQGVRNRIYRTIFLPAFDAFQGCNDLLNQ